MSVNEREPALNAGMEMGVPGDASTTAESQSAVVTVVVKMLILSQAG